MNRLAHLPELQPARRQAPAALAALESAHAAACRAIDPMLAGALRRRVAESLGAPLPVGPASPRTEQEPACFDFADQFVVSVTGIAEGHRDAVADRLGREQVHELARMLYVFDMTDRLVLSLGRLFPPRSEDGANARRRPRPAATPRGGGRRPPRSRDAARRARPVDHRTRAPALCPLSRLQDLNVPSPGGCQAGRARRGDAGRGRTGRPLAA